VKQTNTTTSLTTDYKKRTRGTCIGRNSRRILNPSHASGGGQGPYGSPGQLGKGKKRALQQWQDEREVSVQKKHVTCLGLNCLLCVSVAQS